MAVLIPARPPDRGVHDDANDFEKPRLRGCYRRPARILRSRMFVRCRCVASPAIEPSRGRRRVENDRAARQRYQSTSTGVPRKHNTGLIRVASRVQKYVPERPSDFARRRQEPAVISVGEDAPRALCDAIHGQREPRADRHHAAAKRILIARLDDQMRVISL